jgi:pilus assembly protein CpaE
LRNAKNLIDLLRAARPNDEPPRLVINKHGMSKRPEIKIDDFGAAVGIKPTVVIPFDASLFGTAANNGQMIAETDAKNPIAGSFDHVARLVTRRTETRRARRGGVLAPLLARLGSKKSA